MNMLQHLDIRLNKVKGHLPTSALSLHATQHSGKQDHRNEHITYPLHNAQKLIRRNLEFLGSAK